MVINIRSSERLKSSWTLGDKHDISVLTGAIEINGFKSLYSREKEIWSVR